MGPAKNTEDAVLVDLDGDGATDVVSSSEGDTRTVHVHWAPKDKKRYLDPQAWTTKPIPATAGRERWMFALPMDVDQKHGIDLLVGSKSAGATVSWLEAPADPRDLSAWKLHKIVDAGWIMSMQRIDVNGDGHADVLISDRSGPHQGVYWLQRTAPGSFKLHAVGGSKLTCKFLDTGDVDGDGRLDIVVATNQQGLTGFLGGAKWKPFIINGFYNKAAAVGDIDLDGQPDIVFSCNIGKDRSKIPLGWIRLDKQKLNSGRKTVRRIANAEGTKYDRIDLLDLDGDGDLDVLTCEENAGSKSRGLGVIWYENPTRGRSK